MKRITKVLALLTVMGGLLPAAAVFAHDQAGSLAKAASSIDYYQVQCGSGTTNLSVKIRDLSVSAATPLLSIQVFKDNRATNTTDTVPNDAAYSSPASLVGGDGYYYMTVDKTATGSKNYHIVLHCEPYDDTRIFQIVNQ